MDIPKNGVAFFDSGIGGLTVLAECKKRMPQEVFYYYGDNEHAPYGNLPPESIRAFVLSAFEKLASLEPKAAVVACNTATALCVEDLRRKYSFPIVGAEPAVVAAAREGGEVFVLTTRATYESARFIKLCDKVAAAYPDCALTLQPCDELAGEIERNLFAPDWDASPFLPTGNPDAVVLGCTHYIYLKKRIADFYGAKVFDGNEGMANRLRSFLLKLPQNATVENDRVFFLGGGKWSNKHVYEQMFG